MRNSVENLENSELYNASTPIMSPTSRLLDEAVCDELFEKLKNYQTKKPENGESFKTIAAKIHARVVCSDRKSRERMLERFWQKNSVALEILINSLENCRDSVACCSLIGVVRECITPRFTKTKTTKSSKYKTSQKVNCRLVITNIINYGGVQILIKILANAQQTETAMAEVLIQEVLWVLSQIGQKDPKFVTKVKALNAIKIFPTLLKQYCNQSKSILPILVIIKMLSRNAGAVRILVRSGIVNTLEKAMICVGYTPQLKLKILMECFKYLTTNKLCCAKFVKINMIHSLMRIFERWDRYDGQMRLKICNSVLTTLQHLCTIKSGRKAIKANNGLQLLYRFCVGCPEEKNYDCLLSRVCGIINQCLEKKELCVPEISPARFRFPEINIRSRSVDSNSDAESQANSVGSVGRSYSDLETGEDEDSFNDEPSGPKFEKNVKEIDESKYFAGVIDFQRSDEELLGYNSFFRELGSVYDQMAISKSNANFRNDQKSSNATLRNQFSIKSSKREKSSRCISEFGNSSVSGLKLFAGIYTKTSEQNTLCFVASKVRSIIPFCKVAYPDMMGGEGLGKPEPLNNKDRKVCRAKILTCIDRGLRPGSTSQQTVFDLDSLAANQPQNGQEERLLCNWDELRLGKRLPNDNKQLHFESRFESGNLRKAIQISPREYELILTPDVNSGSRHQWFYFEISNMEAFQPYTFNIINCEKANSQFNFGMKPLLFSVTEAKSGRPGWIRTGSDICYYRNCYQRPGRRKNYLTTSFSVTFPHSYDVCYLAYHFPFTYSFMMTKIWRWSEKINQNEIYFRADNLGDSLNGNENPLLTITAPDSRKNPIAKRKYVFLTSRVHPGESNASWVMHGTLEALLGKSAYATSLREDYIFKIVPMLNNEGVINGCNRYGLTNEDLNRRWSNPNPLLHPTIYHTKGLMEYCTRVLQRPPYVFVDYHGHSRRKNVFLFGCSSSGSWSAADREIVDQPRQYLMLPHLMQKTSPAFALPLCSFKVERHKESTARVAIWRQLGVIRSYTMESSFCGCDQGPLAGLHLDTKHLRDIGDAFCKALALMKETNDGYNFDKIPSGESIVEEGGCMDDEMSSSCESEESDFDD